MEVKMVIFDLDGVLVDACEWHYVALNEALDEIANYKISYAEHIKTFNGIPTRKKLKKLTELGYIRQEDHKKINNLKQEKTIQIIDKYATVSREKIELLSFLKKREIKVACYTNSIRKTANMMLERTGIVDFFDLILTNQDVCEPKPSPEGYLNIIEHFSIDKKNTIIVEDSPKGLEAAINSGCFVVKVKNPAEVNVKMIREFIS